MYHKLTFASLIPKLTSATVMVRILNKVSGFVLPLIVPFWQLGVGQKRIDFKQQPYFELKNPSPKVYSVHVQLYFFIYFFF